MSNSAKSILPAESYSLTELAKVLAPHVRRPGEPMRTVVDKMRKRLKYAIQHEQLQLLDADLIASAQVILWARKKWPEAFGTSSARLEVDLEDGLAARVGTTADVIPGDLEQRRQALMTALQTNSRLEHDLARARDEAQRLRPAAEKYEAHRAKNQDSAKRKRKSR